jgi:RNA polymerase sigma-32 factor
MMSAVNAEAALQVSRSYLDRIKQFPMLSAEEERELARRCRDHGDTAAADRLVTSHLRLVVTAAQRYRGYGVPLDELISAGNVGLVQAVRRFDPERGFRLTTYAIWLIRAAIIEHVLHSVSLVKVATAAAQKKLFFKLRRLKKQHGLQDECDLPPEFVDEIARSLDVPERDVVHMNRRLWASDHSLNASMQTGSDGEWQDWLIDEADDQEATLAEREILSTRVALLRRAINVLNARELQIVMERWCREKRATLDVLARRHGVSRERVRQIEVRALEKLRVAMNESAGAQTMLQHAA